MYRELPERPILRDGDIVFLIHGTFAASSEWINPNSLIASSLRTVAAATIVPFRWSGDNSHSARLIAGSALGEAASRLASLHPNAGLHFVGHSHGGNVALFALRDTDILRRTRSVIFLGTPFIQITERSIEKPIRFFAQVFSIAFTLLVLFAGLFISIDVLRDSDYGVVYWIFVGILAPVLFFWFGRPRVRDGLFRLLIRKLSREQRDSLERLWQPSLHQPVFIATVPADEARMWLRFVDRISYAPWALWEFIYKSLLGVALGWISFGVLLHIQAATLGEQDSAFEDMGEWLGFFPLLLLFSGVIIPVVGLLFSLVFRSNSFAFGWEGLYSYALLRLKPSRYPNWATSYGSMTTVLDPSSKITALRHSTFYTNSALVSDLARWLTASGQNQPFASIPGGTNREHKRSFHGSVFSRYSGWISSKWISAFLSFSATIALGELMLMLHLNNVNRLQIIADGSLDGLKRTLSFDLIPETTTILNSKEVRKWVIHESIRPKSQSCFVIGSLDFSNYSSWFEIEVDDYWFFSDALVQHDQRLKESLMEKHVVVENGYWRSNTKERVLFQQSKEGRRIEFVKKITSKRDVLDEFRISAYNGAEKPSTVKTSISLICTLNYCPVEEHL